MENVVTTHAKKRIKERLGIPYKSAQRQFDLAIERNILRQKELSADFMNWVYQAIESQDTKTIQRDIAMFNNSVFVYGIDTVSDRRVLVTVLNIPNEYRKYLED